MKFLLVLAALLPFVPSSIGGIEAQKISDSNSAFEAASTDANDDSGLTTNAQIFLRSSRGPSKGLSPKGFRLWNEGVFMALVLRLAAASDNKSLILSGYGDNGATAFPLAKERSKHKELVTMLLLPADDGSRGNKGILKGPAHADYDVMEQDLRAWNIANGEKIKILTFLDTNDIHFNDYTLFVKADEEKKKLDTLLKAKIEALENAKKNNESSPEQNTKYIEAVEALKKENTLQYFTKDGVPTGDLENKIKQIVIANLKKLESDGFKYCFEGHGTQAFSTLLGTAVTYPVLAFLAKLKTNEVVMVSLDSPLGTTDEGLHSVDHRYIPDIIVVIFWRSSLLATYKNGKPFSRHETGLTLQLKGVLVIQLNWNDVVSYLFDKATIAVHDLKYSFTATDQEEKTIITEMNVAYTEFRIS